MSEPQGEKFFKCNQCGAKMEFKVGSDSLTCPYCNFVNEIPKSEEDVEELDFHAYLNHAAGQAVMEDRLTIHCECCGAEVTFEENVTSRDCPFCGSNIVATATSSKVIKPGSLLSFKVEQRKAQALFREWIKKLWFAPGKMKKAALQDSGLTGMYVPHWTYDTDTTTFYRGQRGDDYQTTETYTDSEGHTKTRTVTKTRWTPVSGTVYLSFDDVLVLASNSLPKEKAEKLEPWDLHELTPYKDEYLSGFRAESYQIDLAQGFEIAREKMEGPIRNAIRRDIGGDHQRINSTQSRHDNITFKHILLPIWISAYRFQDKSYRFLVNGRTGEVQGERPWDWLKIGLTAGGIATVVAAIAWVVTNM